MKSEIYENVVMNLLWKGFAIKNISGCFDIIARKEGNILFIKVVEDLNSISDISVNELKKLASAVGASPLLIANKSGKKLADNVVYTRKDIFTVTSRTFSNFLNNKPIFIKSNKSGLVADISYRKIMSFRENNSVSAGELSKILGVSKRMVLKYESGASEINFERARRLYDLMGGKVFEPIDIFNNLINVDYSANSIYSEKYNELGFEAGDLKRVPFDLFAKKRNEIILTKVGDNVNSDLSVLTSLLDVDELVIFDRKKPKDIHALSKKEFLELDDADELIEIVKE